VPTARSGTAGREVSTGTGQDENIHRATACVGACGKTSIPRQATRPVKVRLGDRPQRRRLGSASRRANSRAATRKRPREVPHQNADESLAVTIKTASCRRRRPWPHAARRQVFAHFGRRRGELGHARLMNDNPPARVTDRRVRRRGPADGHASSRPRCGTSAPARMDRFASKPRPGVGDRAQATAELGHVRVKYHPRACRCTRSSFLNRSRVPVRRGKRLQVRTARDHHHRLARTCRGTTPEQLPRFVRQHDEAIGRLYQHALNTFVIRKSAPPPPHPGIDVLLGQEAADVEENFAPVNPLRTRAISPARARRAAPHPVPHDSHSPVTMPTATSKSVRHRRRL